MFIYVYVYIYVFREWRELERGDRKVKDPATVLGNPIRKEYYMFEQLKVKKN